MPKLLCGVYVLNMCGTDFETALLRFQLLREDAHFYSDDECIVESLRDMGYRATHSQFKERLWRMCRMYIDGKKLTFAKRLQFENLSDCF
jgi:hypothetical protein